MSDPRAKTPSGSDNTSKPTSAEGKAPAKKSIVAPVIKSKIPKQDKSSASTVSNETKNGDNKPSTPTSSRRNVSNVPSKSLHHDNNPTSISTKSSTKHTPSSVGFVATSVGGAKRVLENQFHTKKNRYVALRQDIVDKQKSSEKAFEDLFQLREKIISSGGRDPGRLEELVPAPSIITGRPRTATSGGDLHNAIDTDLISALETSLRQMSDDLLVFCREALVKRTSVLGWLVDFDSEPSNEMRSPLHMKEEMAGQLDTYKVENVEFEERLDSVRQAQLRQIDELVQRIRCLWHECQVYKKERENPKPADTGNTDDLMKELKIEREKFLKARAKIREQENSVNNSEAKMKQAQETAKNLESQLKQKETALEQKTREFTKLQKSYDLAKTKLEKHNDTVEARMAKLKEELGMKENEAKKMVAEYKKQVQELDRDLQNEKKSTQDFDEMIEKLKSRNTKLEEKCKQLLEIQEKNPDIQEHNTEYDIQLFNDLKMTKKMLADKEEIIRKLQVERDEIIAAADHENDSSKERLTADLLKKTNELQATRNQFIQLQKNYQKMQQRAEHLELRLSDMSRLQAQLKESSGRSYGTQVLQLQQQLTDLRGSLSETNKQNGELEKTCAQLQLKVDRYKRYLRNLEGSMKLRNEARSLLQHKEQPEIEAESSEQSNYNAINAEEYQQVCSMLESKEMQVMKLEKLVKQMEKQEEYSQTQRTRLESRIGELEFALKEGKFSQRNRGFSFL